MAGEMAMLQPFTLQETFTLVRFERWDDVLAQPAPPADRALQSALHHFARGAAHAGQGHAAEAVKEQAAFEAAAGKVPKDGMYLTNNSAPVVLDVARAELAARIADAQDGGARAIAAWRIAVAAEDKVSYDEPPAWLLPTREGLAAALMRAGNAVEAERVYRDDLAINRSNPRALFGLSKALERQKKTAEAAKVKAEFDAAWSGADVQLSDAHLAARKATN
jgi:tetratricopeptide (TPR) repeat protein